MSGSKPFGPGEDFPERQPGEGKNILTFDRDVPAYFTDLLDTLTTYAGRANQFLVVNAAETGVTSDAGAGVIADIAALEAAVIAIQAILNANPIAFGVRLDMAQLEILGLRLEQVAGNPAAPVDGQIWYNTLTDAAMVRINGASLAFYSAADAIALAAAVVSSAAAQAAADAANAEIVNISSDDVLAKVEKPAVKLQYDTIIAEQAGIDTVATTYGVTTQKTNYDNAITALTNYMVGLSPAYTDFTLNTIIVGTTFRSKFADVYSTRQILLDKIADNAYNDIDAAGTLASSASAAATAAQVDAAAATAAVQNISDDAVLSKGEKPEIVRYYNLIIAEQAGIDAQATLFGITTEKTAYDNAVTALTNYITGLSPAYSDYTQDTAIVRATFNTNFQTVYTTRQILLNKIYTEAKAIADGALVLIAAISNDALLSKDEKPEIVKQYNVILAEQAGIDAQADLYGVSKAAYDAAITALTNYLTGLTPVYTDYTQDTVIVRATFNTNFQNVFIERQALLNAISTQADTNTDGAYTLITAISNDALLSANEKPEIVKQYNIILAEQAGIDASATTYGITTEKTAYDNAITALTGYLTGLTPAYNNYTQDTTIVRATFNTNFQTVYTTRQTLLTLIYDKVTKVTLDNNLVVAGRIETGTAALGSNLAGMMGEVTGTPNTDIRFWAGATYTNRATAPWRVQNDGTFYATLGVVGGWTIASTYLKYDGAADADSSGLAPVDYPFYAGKKYVDRATAPFRVTPAGAFVATTGLVGGWTIAAQGISYGTPHYGNGYSAAATDITLASDGSLHAKNFYINVDGTSNLAGTDFTHNIRKQSAGAGSERNLHDANAQNSSALIMVKSITLNNGFVVGSVINIYVEMWKVTTGDPGVCQLQLWRHYGASYTQIGTTQTITGEGIGAATPYFLDYTIPAGFSPGDKIECWIGTDLTVGLTAWCKLFRLRYDDNPVVAVSATNGP